MLSISETFLNEQVSDQTEEVGLFVRNKEETLKKFLPRFSYLFKQWKDKLNFYNLSVYSEVKENIEKYIHGINIIPYKFRSSFPNFWYYTGMTDLKTIKKLERSPFHGYAYWMKIIKNNKDLLDSIKLKQVKNGHVYFSSSSGLQIPIWISVGLHGILTPKEEVAFMLGVIYSWKHYEWKLKELFSRKLDVITNILTVIPFFGFIIGTILEFYFTVRHSWINRRALLNAAAFAGKCGYNIEYLNLIKKLNYTIRLGAGPMAVLKSTFHAIHARIVDFMISLFPFLKYFKAEEILKNYKKILKGVKENQATIKEFFEKIDIELSKVLSAYLDEL